MSEFTKGLGAALLLSLALAAFPAFDHAHSVASFAEFLLADALANFSLFGGFVVGIAVYVSTVDRIPTILAIGLGIITASAVLFGCALLTGVDHGVSRAALRLSAERALTW